MPKFDVVVVGLGAIGSAALCSLAQRGVRVLGIEQFAPGHDRGSSHGETRIIRLGYFEHPSYVPLLRRTYALWRELETASGNPLLHITGILEIGQPDGEVVRGTLAAARLHNLPHQVLNAADCMRRFPAFNLPHDFVGVFQPDGGFLAVERALETLIALARLAGAQIRSGTVVRALKGERNNVRVDTEDGPIEAAAAVIAAGPWVRTLAPGVPVRTTRQVMAWFAPLDPSLFAAGRFPVFLLESRHGTHYGFPPHGGTTIKIAKHHHADETVDPNRVQCAISAADEDLIRAAVAEYIPAANGALMAAKTCLYTVTPDHDFILDRLAGTPNIIVASPCSGHGFKFAPVLGEILADLVTAGESRHDISRFKLDRFG